MADQETMRSMTGVGSAAGALSQRLDAAVRLTSVNGRFLEVALRCQPRLELAELEPAVRGVVGRVLHRGRVTTMVELRFSGGGEDLRFRWEVAEVLQTELARRPAGLDLAPLTLRDLLALPGFAEGGAQDLTAEERDRLLELVQGAVLELDTRRQQEAAALRPQLESLAGELGEFCQWLRTVNQEVGERLRTRVRERLKEALAGVDVPEERVLLEAAIAADRADVEEEAQRLAAHLEHLWRLLGAGGPVGKKLDFLLQEMQREINTAGSKCREVESGVRVVAAKAALERLREQVANLE